MQISFIHKKALSVVPDTTKPVITTTANTITVPIDTVVDKAYQIANNGLTAIDNIDGDITGTAQVTASTITTATAGDKTQTITATDIAGNVQTKTITVTVETALATPQSAKSKGKNS